MCPLGLRDQGEIALSAQILYFLISLQSDKSMVYLSQTTRKNQYNNRSTLYTP